LASTRSSVELVRLEPAEVLARRAEVAAVWTWVTEERVREILPRHAAREGFSFLAAVDAGSIVGFAYAYRGAPGQWWHDAVHAALTPRQRDRWMRPGHVELAELHVAPTWRREGLGGRLHDELLALYDDAPRALLSTQVANEPALALYRNRGWEVLVPRLRFASGGELYSILGRDPAAASARSRRAPGTDTRRLTG
jgi:ribosomal protein S18 acetylase RimI-like enzyme